jgi:hypothetical protein
MRKITTKSIEEKRKRRNSLIIGIVLVFVMFFSVLGYAFRGSEEPEEAGKVIYNGFEFRSSGGFWVLNIGDSQFFFKYSPEEVERINAVGLNPLPNYYQKPLYISSENQEAEYEIYRNLDRFVLRRQPACLYEAGCEEELPIKTCADNFIIIREAPLSNIVQEENCVFISGPQENLTKITDEFLFKIIGVD